MSCFKHKHFCSFPRKFWTSLPTRTELDRREIVLKAKHSSLSNSRYLDRRVRFKHSICHEQKYYTSSHLTSILFASTAKTFSWTIHPSLILTLIHLSQNINPLTNQVSLVAELTKLICLLHNQTVYILLLLSRYELIQTNSKSYCF